MVIWNLVPFIDFEFFIEMIYILFGPSSIIQNNRLYIFNYRDNGIKLDAIYWFQIFYTNDLHIIWTEYYNITQIDKLNFTFLKLKIISLKLSAIYWYQMFCTTYIYIYIYIYNLNWICITWVLFLFSTTSAYT